MSISNSFCEFFDKILTPDFGFKQSGKHWEVNETNPSAQLTTLKVRNSKAEFVGFNQELTRDMSCLTAKRSTQFEDKGCDGIAFVKINDEERLLFVELKSKCTAQNLNDALKQMCISFLKMHAMLSLCEGYSLREANIVFCAATKYCDKEEKEKLKLFAHKASMQDEQKGSGKLLYSLFSDGYISTKLGDLFQIIGINLPLMLDIRDKKITVHLQTAQTNSSTTAIFDYS